jgi:2-hydroxychromene-2-carboxylate isomerase
MIADGLLSQVNAAGRPYAGKIYPHRPMLQQRNTSVLEDILNQLNVEQKPVFDAAQSNAIKDKLRLQTDEALRLGIFGAPSFMTANGELFWGTDRLERALAWAKNGR